MRTLLPNDVAVGRALSNSIPLQPGQLWSIAGDRGRMRIECLVGQIWITQSGDAHDHVLGVGQTFLSSRLGGKIVVQAMTRANISIHPVRVA